MTVGGRCGEVAALKALAKTRPEPGIELVELPVPEPGPGEMLVRVTLCGICGSDLSMYQWREYIRSLVELPRVLGHEFVGTVERVGPGTTIPVGTRITADTDGGCGACRSCRRGHFNACERQVRLGTQRDGGLADYVVVPERSAVPVPEELDDRVAVQLEPFAAAMHAVERIPGVLGAAATVIGPGPIGLFAATALADAGAASVSVVGLETDRHRLEAARRLGFGTATAGTAGDRSAEIVIDAVGSAATLQEACRLATFGGCVALVGLGGVGDFRPFDIVAKELHVLGSWRRLPGTWDRVLVSATRHPELAGLLDGLYTLDAAEEAFLALEERRHVKSAFRMAQ